MRRERTSACIYDFILGCSRDDQCRISDIDEDDDLAQRRNIDPTAALTKYRDQLKSNYLCKKNLVLKGLGINISACIKSNSHNR